MNVKQVKEMQKMRRTCRSVRRDDPDAHRARRRCRRVGFPPSFAACKAEPPALRRVRTPTMGARRSAEEQKCDHRRLPRGAIRYQAEGDCPTGCAFADSGASRRPRWATCTRRPR